MKKLLLLFVLTLFTLTSCNKDNVDIDPGATADKKVELAFNFEQLLGEAANLSAPDVAFKHDYGTKPDGSVQEYPDCSEADPSYIKVTIDGVQYTVQFTALGTSETEVLLLEANAPNIISELIVYDAQGTEIYEMPLATSNESVNGGLTGVPYDMDLAAFTKTKVEIDVVCWHDYSYQVLSWNWFKINYYEVNTLCFYGDICTKFYEWFHLGKSPYAPFLYDGYDFPAIFTVNIYKDGELYDSASNIEWGGIGAPLCIEYLDDPLVDEFFEYEIVLATPTGDEVLYRAEFEDGIHSEDGNPLGFGGEDGILTFDVGNCDSQGNNDIDLEFPAVLPLPENASFKLSGPLHSGDGYAKLTITDQDPGLWAWGTQIEFAGYCADKYHNINLGVEYASKVYSSLEPESSQLFTFDLTQLNWIVNNWDGYTSEEIQQAIWWITDSYGAPNELNVGAQFNNGFVPKVGDWAVVIFDPIEDQGQDDIQLFIVRVDP